MPVAVVAVALLEVARMRLGHGSAVLVARRGDEAEAHEVRPRQRARVVHGEIAHHRHAVELELAVAQRARSRRNGAAPAAAAGTPSARRCTARGAASRSRGSARAARGRRWRAPRRSPPAIRPCACSARRCRRRARRSDRRGRSGTARPARAPASRSSAHTSSARMTTSRSWKKYRSTCTTSSVVTLASGCVSAHAPHVVAPEDADRRGGIVPRARLALAVEEALHVRQEGDELAVVALLELRRIAA